MVGSPKVGETDIAINFCMLDCGAQGESSPTELTDGMHSAQVRSLR